MLSRREFLKRSFLGAGAFALRPWGQWSALLQEWPDAERLGRNCTGGIINIRAKPSGDAPVLNRVYEDTVVAWLREVVGEAPSGVYNRKWVETPEGYIHSAGLQPVYHRPNQPVSELKDSSLGKGMWVEVTVPYVDIYLPNPPASPWLQEVPRPRLYYSQVIWADEIRTNSQGQVLYRINEPYGSYGDIFWAAAEAFRPLTDDELKPIRPDVEDKKIVVDLNYQTLSCFEGQQEVYFCRISSGGKYDKDGNPIDKYSTPLGAHLPWRKVVSIHMSGGSTGAGYDTPGVGWTILFDKDGAAIHSTFWHNDFGTPRSHGCVNCTPEDAKWIFLWATPNVPYDPGNVNLVGPGGTIVDVIAA